VSVTCNEIDAPFHKGADNDEWVMRSRRSTHFTMMNLAIMIFLDCSNAILEHGRPKISSEQVFLGSGRPCHMTTTCSRVTMI